MFEENLSVVYIFLLVISVIEGRIKNPVDKIIGFFSLTFKVKKQSSRIEDQLRIEELSNDQNQINFTYKKVNIMLSFTLFLIIVAWFLPPYNFLYILISYCFAFSSFYFSNKTTHLFDIALEAEKLYKQKQQVGFKKYSSPAECLKKFRASSNKEVLADLDTSIFSNRRE